VELTNLLDEFQRLGCPLVTRAAKEPTHAVKAFGKAIDTLIVGQPEEPGSRLARSLQVICQEVPLDQVHAG
jgi:hypothetical protein